MSTRRVDSLLSKPTKTHINCTMASLKLDLNRATDSDRGIVTLTVLLKAGVFLHSSILRGPREHDFWSTLLDLILRYSHLRSL